MRNWERSLLILITLAVAALLARTTFAPEAQAASDDEDFTIAVCATPSLINELMASDRFRPERENPVPELREQLDDLRQELQDINNRLQNAADDDPNNMRDAQRRREVFQQLQALQGQISRAIENMTASQLSRCFDLVKSSANAVAEDLGYDYVMSTGDPEESLNTDISEVTLRQITARPVIRFPNAVDITDDIRDDLNLD